MLPAETDRLARFAMNNFYAPGAPMVASLVEGSFGENREGGAIPLRAQRCNGDCAGR